MSQKGFYVGNFSQEFDVNGGVAESPSGNPLPSLSPLSIQSIRLSNMRANLANNAQCSLARYCKNLVWFLGEQGRKLKGFYLEKESIVRFGGENSVIEVLLNIKKNPMFYVREKDRLYQSLLHDRRDTENR